MNSNKMIQLSLAAMLAFGGAMPAEAFFWNKKEKASKEESLNPEVAISLVNKSESPEQAQQAESILKEVFSRLSERIGEIEKMIHDGKSGEAFLEAKSLLDSVRIKTGIDPKAKLRESFLIPATFPEDAGQMSDLPEALQNLITRTMKDYRGGLYLDVMNLSKRISLLYIKALHAEVKKTGMTMEDRNKIFRDLVVASVVPMPIVDRNSKKLTIFDEDIANEDHIYMFNREIKKYLLDSPDLKIDEETFDKYREDYKARIVGMPKAVKAQKGDINQCFEGANGIENIYNRNANQVKCVNIFFDTFETIEICQKFVGKIVNIYDRNAYQNKCAQKFYPGQK